MIEVPAPVRLASRIVFVNRYAHPDHSTTSQIVSDLAASLAARGLSVAMVASRQRYDDPSAALPAHETWQGVDIHRFWTSRFGRGNLVALVAAAVARLRGAQLVNWLQDVFPEVAVNLGQPRVPAPLAWLLRRLRNVALRTAAMNIAIGERMAEYLVSEGAPADRVAVVPNWAHEDAIQPMPTEASRLRAELGLAGHFVVGYSGNLGRAHDIETLWDAMQRLHNVPRIALCAAPVDARWWSTASSSTPTMTMSALPTARASRFASARSCAGRPESDGRRPAHPC